MTGLTKFFDLIFTPGKPAMVIMASDNSSEGFRSGLDHYAQNAGIKVSYFTPEEVLSSNVTNRFERILIYKTSTPEMGEKIRRLSEYLSDSGILYYVEDNRLALSRLAGYDFNPRRSDTGIIKSELLNIAGASGMNWSILYPHPDISDMEYLFSDMHPADDEQLLPALKEGVLRPMFFDETSAFSDALKDGIASNVANQFIAVFSKKEITTGTLVYRKYSDRRDERFAIATSIYSSADKELSVTKTPVGSRSAGHILNMEKNYHELSGLYSGSPLCINRVSPRENNELRFDHCSGVTLEAMLDSRLKADDMEGLYRLIEHLTDLLSESGRLFCDPADASDSFSYGSNQRFTELFGELTRAQEESIACEKYLPLSDIDIIFSNFIIKDDSWTLLDYEWVADFPIPFSFLLYRAIYFYFCSRAYRDHEQKNLQKCLEHFGINRNLQELYQQFYLSFDKYVTGSSRTYKMMLDELTAKGYYIPEAEIFSLLCADRGIVTGSCEVFIDNGNGFSPEEQLDIIPVSDAGHLTAVIPLNKPAKALRFDPAERPGLMTLHGIFDENGIKLIKRPKTNAAKHSRGNYYFTTADPQVIIRLGSKQPVSITIKYDFVPISDKLCMGLNQLFGKRP